MKKYINYLFILFGCGLILFCLSCKLQEPASREAKSVSTPSASEETKTLKKPSEAELYKQPDMEATIIRSDEVWQPLQMPKTANFGKYFFKKPPLVQYASFTSLE